MKKTTLFGLILFFFIPAHGQFFDKYGVRIGAGFSNQYWEYQNESFPFISGWKNGKTGFIGQFVAEKKITDFLVFRPAIGYIQKGFYDNVIAPYNNYEPNHQVDLHNISLDLSLKISPMQTKFQPYVVFGFRGNYLVDYTAVYDVSQYGFDVDLNKMTIDGLIGLGITYNNMIYLDFELSPSLTKNFDNSYISIHDSYYSLTLGMNINKMF